MSVHPAEPDPPTQPTSIEALPEVHRREIEQAVKREGRLLRVELCILLLLVVFVIVRQRWLV